MDKKRSFWISLCLVNLCIVAFLGFSLRSKILFPIPFINYRNFLSAHSHFAFAGWAGLSLMTLLIYDLLPDFLSGKKIYQWILTGIEVSSLGMLLMFPFFGYNGITIFFSTLYIVSTFVFAPVFIKDIIKGVNHKTVKFLSISAVASLLVSFLGTLGLAYILLAKSSNSLLYRDSIYTFLHFQYNGFFTIAIFALFLNFVLKKGITIDKNARMFSVFLCLSIVPALFLSLLWHNNDFFYVLAALGCVFIIISLVYFFKFFRFIRHEKLFSSRLAKALWLFAVFSFGLKMVLNVGTIFPTLSDAVYGDRPVIIGFLHLVFLGFLTFYLLASFIDDNLFTKRNKIIWYPFLVFSFGIVANEFLLMLQGLGILFKTNHEIFKWLLWAASIILFAGACLIAFARLLVKRQESKEP
ncbi:MAG TPA: hypothetical protein VIQ00_12940 [Chitinophagaceae bacterium]